MEFCPQLSAFQGVIISADNVHSFSRLSSKAGNEEQFKFVIESIRKFLEEGRYISSSGLIEEAVTKVRKFAFFIVLNADLSVLTEMTNMEEIELVIWTIPTIPKCLLCEMFWQLHFEKFVYETIAFPYPELGLEVASVFIDNIKYFSPGECLNKIQIISSALYKLVCRYHFFNLDSNMFSDKFTVTLNLFQRSINFFTDPPNTDRLNTLSKDDYYRHIGNCMYSMLLLVNECFEQFTSKQDLNPLNDNIYMLTYIGVDTGNVNQCIDFKMCDSPNQAILDCLNKCHIALLDKCQELVMGVSLDIFCAWSEFQEHGRTVQRKIGELCYRVRTKLLSIPSVCEHPVVSMYQQISCKPVDLNDIIAAASVDTIIENINQNSEDKATWLRALIEKDQIYKDESTVYCIASNLDLLNEEECYQVYKNLRNYVIDNSEDVGYLESFAVRLFQHCNIEAKHEILEEYFGNNCFSDMIETEEFTHMMTETFNKLIVSPDADLTNILCVFLQSPQKVYAKIFSLATENIQQTNIMLKAMKLLENYSNHYYSYDTEPCIIRISQGCIHSLDTDAKKVNFLNFMCGLKNSNSITGTKLLLLIIMPNIHSALLNSDISCLNTQCKLLNEAYTLEELLEYRAPMLAMIGQVLEVVRWKINSFEAISPPTLQLALEMQSALFNTYTTEIPDNECNWLKSKLRNLQPLNMYYYRMLWNPPGSSYVEVITGIQLVAGMSTVQLATRLSQAFCSLNQQEWNNVWDSLTVFGQTEKLEIFHDSLFLIAMLERANRTEATWGCMLYCYRCFIYAVRYNYLREPLDDIQVSVVLEKLAVTCNSAKDDNTEDISKIILPLFAYLAERRNDYSFNVSQYLRTKLKHQMFLDTFTKVFANGAD